MPNSLEASRRHCAIHAGGPQWRQVWLFHSHAYFDHSVPERVVEARAFMELTARTFAGTDHLQVRRFHPSAAGPHPRGSFEVLFTREVFTEYVLWLSFARPAWLDILVHPMARSPLLDHTRRALWLGTPLAIDCAILMEAAAKHPATAGCEESFVEGAKTPGQLPDG